MPGPSILKGSYHVAGQLSCEDLIVPPGSVTGSGFSDAPANALPAEKQDHQHQPAYRQPYALPAEAAREVVHVVRGLTGEVVSFQVGVTVAATGNSTVIVDLCKNGVSVLAAPKVIDNAVVASAVATVTLDDDEVSLVEGDLVEVEVVVFLGTGTPPRGLFCVPTIREKAE